MSLTTKKETFTMKLKFDVQGKAQADPYIFEDGGKLYLYVTARDGVEAYSADSLLDVWHYEGIIGSLGEGEHNYWAPSVIRYEGKYYVYTSFVKDAEGDKKEEFEYMYVASADSPLGPFTNWKKLYDYFSIDSHIVQTDAGLFLWSAMDNHGTNTPGTRIFLDRMLDPYTPEGKPREMLTPDFKEEMFRANRYGDGRDYYTLEGAFWFKEGEWQYVMYSGGCFENDTYHVGYAVAKTDEADLCKIDFKKVTDGERFNPVLIKNEYEEGTGHHSVIKLDGQYYAIYHARDYGDKGFNNPRTARICKLHVADGVITAERYEDHL